MASVGTKRCLRKALDEKKNAPVKRYLRELVVADGPMRTERLLSNMLQHHDLSEKGFEIAMKVLAQETKANRRIIQRMYPKDWHSR